MDYFTICCIDNYKFEIVKMLFCKDCGDTYKKIYKKLKKKSE